MGGVVGGIAGYGNCIGIPDVGGELAFDASYNGNPLVNAMCLGLARHDEITLARAAGPGNALLLVGRPPGATGSRAPALPPRPWATTATSDARRCRSATRSSRSC